MKSPRGFAAALLFLSALPLALLAQMVAGHGADAVIHILFALGSALASSAMSDFRTPAWASWLGRLSIASLAIIFALQGTSDLIRNDALSRVAFQGLGQQVEGWLLAGFLLWCLIALVIEGRGNTKRFGLFAVAIAGAVRVVAALLPWSGASLESKAPALKLLYLLPFVWLLAESRRRGPTDLGERSSP